MARVRRKATKNQSRIAAALQQTISLDDGTRDHAGCAGNDPRVNLARPPRGGDGPTHRSGRAGRATLRPVAVRDPRLCGEARSAD